MASECEIHLEMEFTPSAWSKRFSDREQVLRNHIQHVEQVSEQVLSTVPNKLDVEYGDGPAEKYDIFGTDLPDDSPILVFVHGGFWQELSRQQSRYPAQSLYKAGFKTIIVGYDLCPSVTLYEITKQIKAAAKAVVNYAKTVRSRGIYFAGHSAGAHLIAKMLSDHDFIQSLPQNTFLGSVLVSGVFDLTNLTKTSVNKAINLNEIDTRKLSPQFDSFYHLKGKKIRFYILAGEHDSYTFKKQSRDFYDKIMECCEVEHVNFEIKDGVDHFDIMENVTEDDNYLVHILNEDLRRHSN